MILRNTGNNSPTHTVSNPTGFESSEKLRTSKLAQYMSVKYWHLAPVYILGMTHQTIYWHLCTTLHTGTYKPRLYIGTYIPGYSLAPTYQDAQ